MTTATLKGAPERTSGHIAPVIWQRISRILLSLGKRLLSGVLVLWGAATVTFFALHIPRGDPALMLLGGVEANPTPEVLAQVRSDWGFDQHIFIQYFGYISRLATGDLGVSYQQRMTVVDAISTQLAPTVQLALTAAAVSILLTLVVSLATAKRGPLVTSVTSNTCVVLASIPGFVIGILLLFLFAAIIPLFPSSGTEGVSRLVLPVVTLALSISATLIQVLRTELDEVLEQPFILTARTRGLSLASAKLKHALRHALLPIATMSGFIIANLLGGAVLIETVFSRQGIGRVALEAVQSQDVPLVIGVVLFAAFVFVLVNFIVDLLYTVIDPRLETT